MLHEVMHICWCIFNFNSAFWVLVITSKANLFICNSDTVNLEPQKVYILSICRAYKAIIILHHPTYSSRDQPKFSPFPTEVWLAYTTQEECLGGLNMNLKYRRGVYTDWMLFFAFSYLGAAISKNWLIHSVLGVSRSVTVKKVASQLQTVFDRLGCRN